MTIEEEKKGKGGENTQGKTEERGKGKKEKTEKKKKGKEGWRGREGIRKREEGAGAGCSPLWLITKISVIKCLSITPSLSQDNLKKCCGVR